MDYTNIYPNNNKEEYFVRSEDKTISCDSLIVNISDSYSFNLFVEHSLLTLINIIMVLIDKLPLVIYILLVGYYLLVSIKLPSKLRSLLDVKRRYVNCLLRSSSFLAYLLIACKFSLFANGAFSRTAKLFAPDGAASDLFGGTIGIYDTTAMIGACGDDDKGTSSGKIDQHLLFH
jgi:hypothetical protein